GPVAGALTGAASEALGSDAVWRQRLMGASRSTIEGFGAGLVGLLPIAGANGTVAHAAMAMAVTFGLAQVARGLVGHVGGIQPARAVIAAGALVDSAEMVIVAPIVATLLFAQAASPVLAITTVASLIAVLAVAERAHARQAAQLELERTVARTDALTSAP